VTRADFAMLAHGMTDTLATLQRLAAQQVGDTTARARHDAAGALRLLFAAAGAYSSTEQGG
jgi:hypothetical protein